MNINKKNLFIIISIFLGLIISLFYNQKFDKNFIILFILISIIIYIIFYFLGDIHENFNIKKVCNYVIEEEELINYNKILQEEEEENISKENISEEEENMYHYSQPTINEIASEEESINDSSNNNIIIKPDISKFSFDNAIPVNTLPLNINISYNSQNSVNELDNITEKEILNRKNPSNKNYSNQDIENTNTNTNVNDNVNNNNNVNNNVNDNVNVNSNLNSNNNLNNNTNQGRIYTNSDWIYGTNAWTNNPNYYIPQKGCNNMDYNYPQREVPMQLNESHITKNFRKSNSVSPIIINQPWSEYKSGDDEEM